jgi:hypothetical protein
MIAAATASGLCFSGIRVKDKKKTELALPAFPFFPPYLLHNLIGNISRRIWLRDRRPPFLQRSCENAAGNQSLLLLELALQKAGNDPRHRLVAVAHQHLFAVPHELNMGAQLRLQIAYIHGSHNSILADMRMLHIYFFPRLIAGYL